MDRHTQSFIVASLLYLLLGVLLGIDMAISPQRASSFIPTHVHLLLLGWVSMMIYGVGYHVLPRFSGRPIRSVPLAWVQFGLSNAGLLGMGVSFALIRLTDSGQIGLVLSSLLEATSVVCFIVNVSPTLLSRAALPPVDGGAGRASAHALPIHAGTTIGEAMARMPGARAVFERHFGAGCFTCPGIATETIAQGAAMHGVPVEAVIADLLHSQGQTPPEPPTVSPPLPGGHGGLLQACSERSRTIGAPQPPQDASGPPACLLCGNTSADAPLLPCEVSGKSRHVCVRCIPRLIHG